MIRAGFSANGKAKAPPELELAFQAKSWGVLPYAGGLLDQPAGLIMRMTVAYNAYSYAKSYLNVSSGSMSSWTKNNPEGFKFIRWLEEQEYDDN